MSQQTYIQTAGSPSQRIRIERIALERPEHSRALVDLLDEYASGPQGGGVALATQVREQLPGLLATRAHYIGWLAFDGEQAVGLLNAFEGVSTFRARPLLNIHDIAVTANHRGRGLGRALLAQAEHHAREIGCCKLTLEVLEGNRKAIDLYRAAGFAAYELDPEMGRALFFEKWLKP